jgi:hypothetical protein
MPMAIDRAALTRRHWLALAAGTLGGAVHAAPTRSPGLLAAWQCAPQARAEAARYQVGVLAVQGEALAVQYALDVPTRAHGLLAERGGSVLAVARRPGDWLLRWRPGEDEPQTAWSDPDRAFNGHVIASADGRRLYTTETDLETGAGLVGVRDLVSLDKLAEWPTGGMDPHELLLDADGSLLVANGGIPTLPETGRLKIGLERMDASLARLDTRTGAVQGQWRLADPRLSLRHLAWGGTGGQRVLGIALQAEHADAAQRQGAPLLALFDGRALRAVGAPQPLGGYGGDIAWTPGGFAVSCPRVDGLARYAGDGGWRGFTALREACALAEQGPRLWAGGLGQALQLGSPAQRRRVPDLRLDNHWLALG